MVGERERGERVRKRKSNIDPLLPVWTLTRIELASFCSTDKAPTHRATGQGTRLIFKTELKSFSEHVPRNRTVLRTSGFM